MKGTEQFKKTIQSYIEKRANEDILFSERYNREDKNIDDCIKYIFTAVKKSGAVGFTDDEVYSMAVHYYDEDEVDFENIQCEVVVNHRVRVELTDEEKRQARKEVFDEYKAEFRRKQTAKTPTKTTEKAPVEALTLFDAVQK